VIFYRHVCEDNFFPSFILNFFYPPETIFTFYQSLKLKQAMCGCTSHQKVLKMIRNKVLCWLEGIAH